MKFIVDLEVERTETEVTLTLPGDRKVSLTVEEFARIAEPYESPKPFVKITKLGHENTLAEPTQPFVAIRRG